MSKSRNSARSNARNNSKASSSNSARSKARNNSSARNESCN